MNLPDSEFLSAPLGILTLLHLLTLTLHFAAMNCLLGGVVITIGAAWRGRWEAPDLKDLARMFPSAMAATVTLGVAPLLFLQMVYPRQVYAAAIVSGWCWLLVVATVMVAYYALYWSSMKSERTGRISLPALTLALAGLLYVSLSYSSVFSLAEQPKLIRSLYAFNPSGWVWNPPTTEGFLRWLHMVLGALTVGGFFVGWVGRNRAATFATGKAFLLWGMLASSAAGAAYLVALRPILRALMHTPAIWALTLGILLSAGALHFFFKKSFLLSGSMLFVSMFTMVYARHTVRLLKLAGQFDPASWRIAPQWSVFILFLVCFLGMLGVLGYLFRLVATSAEEPA
jgi:hypothetical protein